MEDLRETVRRLQHEREQAQIAEQVLTEMGIGIWRFELDPGALPRMYGNASMDQLLGCDGTALTPEEYYHAWYDHVHPEHYGEVKEAVDAMIAGRRSEVQYPFLHPKLGEMWVRCGGQRDNSYTKGVRIMGRHQNVSELMHVEKKSFDAMSALAQEYHTLGLVDKTTHQLRLVRSTGRGTLQQAVEMVHAAPNYSVAVERYAAAHVVPDDRDRLIAEAALEVVLDKVVRMPLYTVNYRRIDATGQVGYHQVAFANAGENFLIAFRDIQSTVERELQAQRRAEELVLARRLAEEQQSRAEMERRVSESLEVLVAEQDILSALRRIMAMWCDTLGSQWCHLGRFDGDRYVIVQSYAAPGTKPVVTSGMVIADLRKYDANVFGDAGHEYYAVPDCKNNPITELVARVSPNPDAARDVSSCYCHRIDFGRGTQGTLVIMFREPHALTVNEEQFFKALSRGLQLALMRQVYQQELESDRLQLKLERDRAIAAEKAKSLFFSSVSHDIRTPLNAIVGFAELLEAGVTDPADHDRYISTIRSSGKMLARLVNDVLDLSKLESGRLEIFNEPTDVPALVREVSEAFGVARARSSLIYETSIAEMPRVSIDPQRVRQLLYNLLSNAFKYTDHGRILLKTTWNDGTLTLSVIDTGKGISAENIDRILQPFVQVADRNHRDGTGLGLSICQRLANLMGGEMTIDSEVGKGSTFSIVFRGLETVADSAPEHALPVVLPRVRIPRTKRLLIVDDSSVNRAVLKAMLMKNGASDVVTACDGGEAFSMLQQDSTICAVLTDLWMPVLDGAGLLRKIRTDKKLAALPVYLITADVEADKSAEIEGCTGVLLKPITRQSIAALLD